jgi:hypothetical protein
MDAPNDGVQFERESLPPNVVCDAKRFSRRASIGGNERRGYNAPSRATALRRYPFLRKRSFAGAVEWNGILGSSGFL